MVTINENYLKLPGNYLFAEIAKRRTAYQQQNPQAKLISLGIGDVTRPLVPAVIEAMHKAVEDMSRTETFKGYSPDRGYDFLIESIVENDYKKRGIDITSDEVFVSDGAKSDTGNFQEIFSTSCRVAVTDPVYPVYVDSNVMAGRTGSFLQNGMFENITYLACNADNAFVPELPKTPVDIIYLCLPNNPTGMTLPKQELVKWVDYARKNNSIILFDSAYEAYIKDGSIPHSIYEVEGAKEVAIEFRSYSKTAGFTGTRCAYTIVPKECRAFTSTGEKHMLNALWTRRQATKFNGVPYIIQKGAAAIYTKEGQAQCSEIIDYYMENARLIREGIKKLGVEVFGGVNAPYIWLRTPNKLDSWEFFDKLLNEAHVIGTPGAGFGPNGRGYFRLTAFGSRENTIEAIDRILNRLKL